MILLNLTAANFIQTDDKVYILSPQAGEAVRGLVQIKGNTSVDGFISYELAFSFGMGATETWFLIKQGNEPVNNGVLGEWDTSVLTDGTYFLRLIVNQINAPPTIDFIEGIRVRNYSPLETNTPTATSEENSINTHERSLNTATSTFIPRQKYTPTPLKKNPAEVNPAQIDIHIQRGAIFSLVMLGFLGFYVLSRRQR